MTRKTAVKMRKRLRSVEDAKRRRLQLPRGPLKRQRLKRSLKRRWSRIATHQSTRRSRKKILRESVEASLNLLDLSSPCQSQ